MGKNLPSPPPYCFTSPEEIARKQMLSNVYIISPFIYVYIHCNILVLLVAETILNFNLKSPICFITVCLNHLKKEKDLSKCKISPQKAKLNNLPRNLKTSSVTTSQQARAAAFWVITFNLFHSQYHKNNVLKPIYFKAIHLQIRKKFQCIHLR